VWPTGRNISDYSPMMKKTCIIAIVLWPLTKVLASTIGGTPAENALRQGSMEYFGALIVVFLSVPKILVMTIALTYSQMAFGYTFVALLLGNVAAQYFIRLPVADLLDYDYVVVADLAVAVVDAVYVKLLSCIDACQSFDFERLKWRYAALAAFLGNIVSFLIFRGIS
jgi:hypothetical protein